MCSKPAGRSSDNTRYRSWQFGIPMLSVLSGSCEAIQECAVDFSHALLPMEAFKELAEDARECFISFASHEQSEHIDVAIAMGVAASWFDTIVSHGTVMPPVAVATSPQAAVAAALVVTGENYGDAAASAPVQAADARLAAVATRDTQNEEAADAEQRSQRQGSLLAHWFPNIHRDSVLLKLSCLQVGVYALTCVVESAMTGIWSTPSACVLFLFGGSWGPAIAAGSLVRLVLPIFLHATAQHLFLNTFFQCRFGFAVERVLGPRNFLCLYLMSGAIGNLFSAAWDPWKLAIGCSTSALGLLGASAALQVMGWNAMPQEDRMTKLWLTAIIAGAFVVTSSAGTDVYGHLGGFIAGVSLTTLLVPQSYVERMGRQDVWPRVQNTSWIILGAITGMSAGHLLLIPTDASHQVDLSAVCPFLWPLSHS